MEHYYCEQLNIVEQLSAAERRMDAEHPRREDVSNALRRELAGRRGQRALEFPMRFLDYAVEPIVFHNLRLRDEQGYFELDVLILSEQFILLLEAKNWYGTLLIDGMRQVIRIGDQGVEEGMPHPVSQVKVQHYRLQKWLSNEQFTENIPLPYFVVIGYTSTILKPFSPESSIPASILHAHELPWKVHELQRKHPKPAISRPELKRLATRMRQAHSPRKMKITDQFDLRQTDFLTGVFCPECSCLPMEWQRGRWCCSHCNHEDKTAHIQALTDFELLHGADITNAKAREFLQIDSPNVTKKLLQQHGKPIGNGSRRFYQLDLRTTADWRFARNG